MSFLLFLGNSRQVSSNHMKNLVNYSLRFFPHHVRLKFQTNLSVHSSKNLRRNSLQSPAIRMSKTCSGDPNQAKENISVVLAGFLATIFGAQKRGQPHKIRSISKSLLEKMPQIAWPGAKTSSKVEPKMKLSTVSFSAVAVQTPQSKMIDQHGTSLR